MPQSRSLIRRQVIDVYWRLMFQRVNGLVCVSHELARSPLIARFRLPTTVVSNGIAPEGWTVRPPRVGGRPRAVVLSGTNPITPWLGLDKVLALAAGVPAYDFELVGIERDELPAVIPPNVIAHGFMAREAYAPLLSQADVGIGTLALHRKSLSEASPLKVREYLMAGLPVLLGYEDTDFPDPTPWFMLRLPNSEDNVLTGLDVILGWLDTVLGQRVSHEEIVPRIGLAEKELARLRFMSDIMAGRPLARNHSPPPFPSRTPD